MKRFIRILVIAFVLMVPIKAQAKGEYFIAHRGLSGIYPDNTMIAVKASLDNPKVKAIAIDPRLTADKKLVLCHDDSVKKYTGKNILISRSICSDITSMHYSQRFLNRKYGKRKFNSKDVRFATLDEAVKAVATYNKKHPKSRKRIYIKLSHDVSDVSGYAKAISRSLVVNKVDPSDVVFWGMGIPFLENMYIYSTPKQKRHCTYEICMWTYDVDALEDNVQKMLSIKRKSVLKNANLALYIWGCGYQNDLFSDITERKRIKISLNKLRKSGIDIVYGRLEGLPKDNARTIANLSKLGIKKIVTTGV